MGLLCIYTHGHFLVAPPPEDHVLGVNLRLVELDPNAPPPPTNVPKKMYSPTLAFHEQSLTIEGQYFVKQFQCKNREGLPKSVTGVPDSDANEKSTSLLHTNPCFLLRRPIFVCHSHDQYNHYHQYGRAHYSLSQKRSPTILRCCGCASIRA